MTEQSNIPDPTQSGEPPGSAGVRAVGESRPSMAEKIFLGPDGLRAGWRLLIFITTLFALSTALAFVGRLLGHRRPTNLKFDTLSPVRTLLFEGGTFLVKQGEVAPAHWDVMRMDIHMNGKALFFKTISIQQQEHYRDYVRVPDGTTLQQAAELLKRKCDSVDTAASPRLQDAN